MAEKLKPGPKPLPIGLVKRRGVLVKYDDGEYLKVKTRAAKTPLAVYIREKSLR